MAYKKAPIGSRINMKLTACFLLMSAGVCSAVLADEPPLAPQPPAAQAPAPSAAVASAGPTEAQIKQMRGRGFKQAEQTGKEYVNSIQQQGSAVPFKGT
jgi:hypothetical protein